MRRWLATCVAKILSYIAQLLGKQGVTLAGKVALMIDPTILEVLAREIKEKIIVVCGTNGKTTTNNLLAATIESSGKRVICNKTGSNMLNGIVSSFVLGTDFWGHIDYDYACLEIDEASAKIVFPHIHPDLMIITNLFRDQLDRYGEIDITMQQLLVAIKQEKDNLCLLVNGDDSLSYYIALSSGKAYRTFGVSDPVENQKSDSQVQEGIFCPSCGHKLEYEYVQFSQIGMYHCHHCDFDHPSLDWAAHSIQVNEGLIFSIQNQSYRCGFRGFYNVYNIIAVYGAINYLNLPTDRFEEVLDTYHPENGRNEVFKIGDCQVILNLAKNPAGFNQNIYSVLADRKEKRLVIAINDLDQDGRDISWLWDVDFQLLKDDSVSSIYVTGRRRDDLKLRFKYEDIRADVYEEIESAIRRAIHQKEKNVYVLVNYTCLYKTHLLLKEMERKG